MFAPTLAERAIGSLITLYMLALLLRWGAAWLEVDLYNRRLRWVPRITDPYIDLVRRGIYRLAGQPGPADWAPIVALLLVWVFRLVTLQY